MLPFLKDLFAHQCQYVACINTHENEWEHSRKNNLQMIFLSIFLTSSQVKKFQVVIILTGFSYLVFFSLLVLKMYVNI